MEDSISTVNKKNQMAMRMDDIRDLLSKGHTASQIADLLSHKYGVTPKTIMNNCTSVLNAELGVTREERRAMALFRYDHIYKISVLEGRYKIAVDAQKEMDKVAGLYKDEAQVEEKPPQVIRVGIADFSQPLKAVGDPEDGD